MLVVLMYTFLILCTIFLKFSFFNVTILSACHTVSSILKYQIYTKACLCNSPVPHTFTTLLWGVTDRISRLFSGVTASCCVRMSSPLPRHHRLPKSAFPSAGRRWLIRALSSSGLQHSKWDERVSSFSVIDEGITNGCIETHQFSNSSCDEM